MHDRDRTSALINKPQDRRRPIIARLPFANKALPEISAADALRAFEELDLTGYDLVISIRIGTREGRDHPSRCGPHLLLPLADALSVGSVSHLPRRTPVGRHAALHVADDADAARLGHGIRGPRGSLRRQFRLHRAKRIRQGLSPRQHEVIFPPVDLDAFSVVPDADAGTSISASDSSCPTSASISRSPPARRLGRRLVIVGNGSGTEDARLKRDGRADRRIPWLVRVLRGSQGATMPELPGTCCSRAKRTSASFRSKPWPPVVRSSRTDPAAR